MKDQLQSNWQLPLFRSHCSYQWTDKINGAGVVLLGIDASVYCVLFLHVSRKVVDMVSPDLRLLGYIPIRVFFCPMMSLNYQLAYTRQYKQQNQCNFYCKDFPPFHNVTFMILWHVCCYLATQGISQATAYFTSKRYQDMHANIQVKEKAHFTLMAFTVTVS